MGCHSVLQIFPTQGSKLGLLHCRQILYYLSHQKKVKSWLTTKYEKIKLMAYSPILHGKQRGKKVEVVTDFLFLGSKIPVFGDCIHELRRCLPLDRKTSNLDIVLKSRDITMLTNICIVKAMVLPAVTFDCESWTVMKSGS